MLAISSIGLPSVVAKFVSERMALNDKKGAKRIYKLCVMLFVSTGLFLSLLLFFGAEFIGEKILNIKDIAIIFKVLAPAIFIVSSSSMIRGYFQGLEDMIPTSVSQVIEQLLNCIFSIIFVKAAMGKEPHIMAAAANFAATVSIIITFIYLIIYYIKNRIKLDNIRKKVTDNNRNNNEILKAEEKEKNEENEEEEEKLKLQERIARQEEREKEAFLRSVYAAKGINEYLDSYKLSDDGRILTISEKIKEDEAKCEKETKSNKENNLLSYDENRSSNIENTNSIENETTISLIKKILKYSIPITLGSVISVLNGIIDLTTVSRGIQKAFSKIFTEKVLLEKKAMEMQGILGKVETITALPIAVNLAISTAILPNISAAKARGNEEEIAKRVKSSIVTSIIFILPCAVGLAVLSDAILRLFYPNAPDGGLVMVFLSIAMIFIGINQIISSSLHGIGKTLIPTIAIFVGAIVKIILNIVLVENPNINIYGAAIGSICCHIVNFAIAYPALKKYVHFKLDRSKDILKPILISILMGFVVYFSYIALNSIFRDLIAVVISIAIGAITYFKLIFKLKVITKEDVLYLSSSEKLVNILEKLELI